MIELAEHQFEILPDEAALDGVGFGIGLDVSMDDNGWDPGNGEWLTQDSVNQIRGTRNFGRDAPTGLTHTFALHVDQTDTETAVDALEDLRSAWLALDAIETPGATSTIRYRLANRVRRFYGRPRRWAAPPSNRIIGGYVPITCTFDTVDHLYYEDLESSVTIPFVQVSEGGWTFPVTFPVQTLPPGQREGAIHVGGKVPTHPIIRFNGPVTNPWLECGSQWKVELNMSLLEGEYVDIDTRPWRLSVLRNGTYSVAGKLGRRIRLKDVTLRPGPQELNFGGTSAQGTASVTVSWRGAYVSI